MGRFAACGLRVRSLTLRILGMIEVSHLTRIFRTYKKRPGFWGGVRGLFLREFEETRAADDISFSIAEG